MLREKSRILFKIHNSTPPVELFRDSKNIKTEFYAFLDAKGLVFKIEVITAAAEIKLRTA
jgi:hypothetical protein